MRHKRRKATPKNGFIANSQYSAKLLALNTNFPSNSEPLIREAVICQI